MTEPSRNRPRAARLLLLFHLVLFAASARFMAPGNCAEVAAGSGETLDFADQLPRTPANKIADSLGAFRAKPGFRVIPIATEPLVVDPVAITFDADGALYVVEMRGYSEDDEANLGRIRKLVDRDDDGRYDTSTVFADGLSWPTAITCYNDGVLITAAPDLIYLKDTDDDGVANHRQIWLTGFQKTNVQGLVNSLQWGVDNRIHGATSSSGARLRRPEASESDAIDVRGRDFSIDPRHQTVLATSGGGQHGMTFNRWGEKFTCQNSDHAQQIVYEDRYLKRNRFAKPPLSRISIATDGPQADVFRTSPVEPWRVIRTRLRVSGQVPGPIERGGRDAGYFTGATGIRAFHGDRLPAAALDHLFVCDVGSNLIHRKQLISHGIHYTAERIDDQSEFLTSDDVWFRPVQLANGPEGVLYVVDMCREVVEHPASLPPAIKQHLDLTSGRNLGRIWAIVTTDFQHRPQPHLSSRSVDELVRTLAHPNGWHRQTAARLLYERNDTDTAISLRHQLGQTRANPESQIVSLNILASLDALRAEDLVAPLQDENPHVRRHALRLVESIGSKAPLLWDRLFAMTADPSPAVAQQLAFSLGELPSSNPERNSALQQLALNNELHPFVLAAIQNANGSGAGELLTQLATNQSFGNMPTGEDFLRELASQVGLQNLEAEVAGAVTLLQSLADKRPAFALSILPKLATPADNRISTRLQQPDLQELTSRLVKEAQLVSLDSRRSDADRRQAIGALAVDSSESTMGTYGELLAPSQPPSIQAAALKSLTQQSKSQFGPLLLEAWKRATPDRKPEILSLLMNRPAWQQTLIESLISSQVDLRELSASHQQLLRTTCTNEQWSRIEATRDGAGFTDTALTSKLARYQAKLVDPPDLASGRDLFRRNCAACHRVDYFGHELAPNLSAMKSRGAEAMLLNILDPNREVNPQYFAYNVVLRDGRVLSGMIRGETSTSIELVEAENRAQTLLRVEIEQLSSTRLSLMPTDLDRQLSPKQMADLIGYLMHANK